MADNIFGGVEPPAWLSRLSQPADMSVASRVVGEMVGGLANASEDAIKAATKKQEQGIETNWIKELPGQIKPDLLQARLNILQPLWQIKAKEAQLNMAQTDMNIQDMHSQIEMRQQKMEAWTHDQKEWSRWILDHPTWQSREYAAPPALFSPEFEKNFQNMQIADAKNIQHRGTVEAIRQWSKDIQVLRELDPIAAANYDAGQQPTPEKRADLMRDIARAREAKAAKDMPYVTEFEGRRGMMQKSSKGEWYFKEFTDKERTTKLSPGVKSELAVAQHRVETLDKQLADPMLSPDKKLELQQELLGAMTRLRTWEDRADKELDDKTKKPTTTPPPKAPQERPGIGVLKMTLTGTNVSPAAAAPATGSETNRLDFDAYRAWKAGQ
jgi:hypothetical protein